MKSLFKVALLAILLTGGSVGAQEPLSISDVTGPLQNWRVDSTTITVSGKTYELTSGTIVLDGGSNLINRSALKSGSRVMLMLANNKVTHVILNPVQPSPFDRPNR